MYEVIKRFTDMLDDGHVYNIGDVFPRKGAKVSDARIAKLASADNRQGTPLIKESLNPATPASQITPPSAEQGAPLLDNEAVTETKHKRSSKKK